MKILVAIANYGTKNLVFVKKLLDQYRTFTFDVDIVVFSNIEKNFGEDVEVVVGLPTKDPWSLPFAHRALFAERQDDYDLFIYSEDDTEIKESHVKSFLLVTPIIPRDKISGFIRYEVSKDGIVCFSSVHSTFYWDPYSVFRSSIYTFARLTNDHSACFILTREQLKRCISSGGFLVEPHAGRYDMLCSAATDPYTQCGMEKVICISHLRDFCLHHLPNAYLGKMGIEALEIDRQIEKLKNLDSGDCDRHGPLFRPRTSLDVVNFDKRFYEPVKSEVIELVPPKAKEILSVGCERGLTEGELITRGHTVTAVPLDAVIAESANFRGIETVSPHFERSFQELKDRRFDGIMFNNVLQHLCDPASVIRKYEALLRAGGFVLVAFDNFAHISLMKRRLLGEPTALRVCSPDGFKDNGIHIADERSITTWLNEAGLNVEARHHHIEQRWVWISRMLFGSCDTWLGRRGAVISRPPTG